MNCLLVMKIKWSLDIITGAVVPSSTVFREHFNVTWCITCKDRLRNYTRLHEHTHLIHVHVHLH